MNEGWSGHGARFRRQGDGSKKDRLVTVFGAAALGRYVVQHCRSLPEGSAFANGTRAAHSSQAARPIARSVRRRRLTGPKWSRARPGSDRGHQLGILRGKFATSTATVPATSREAAASAGPSPGPRSPRSADPGSESRYDAQRARRKAASSLIPVRDVVRPPSPSGRRTISTLFATMAGSSPYTGDQRQLGMQRSTPRIAPRDRPRRDRSA